MEERPVVEQRYGAARREFIDELYKLGPGVSTTIFINDRSFLLEAGIRLIEQLPEYSRLGRRGMRVVVDPDPFASPRETGQAVVDPTLTTRLIGRQDETDRLAAEERRTAPLREKLWRLLTGRRW